MKQTATANRADRPKKMHARGAASEKSRACQPKSGRLTRIVTEAEILAKRTPAGGWRRADLAEWGVPWPPPKGWKDTLIALAEAAALLRAFGSPSHRRLEKSHQPSANSEWGIDDASPILSPVKSGKGSIATDRARSIKRAKMRRKTMKATQLPKPTISYTRGAIWPPPGAIRKPFWERYEDELAAELRARHMARFDDAGALPEPEPTPYMSRMPVDDPLTASVRFYNRHGLRVALFPSAPIPLRMPTKGVKRQPRFWRENGVTPVDRHQICLALGEDANDEVVLPLGRATGVMSVRVTPEVDGHATMAALIEKIGPIGYGAIVGSPGDHLNLLFKMPRLNFARVKLGNGVVAFADDYFVMMPKIKDPVDKLKDLKCEPDTEFRWLDGFGISANPLPELPKRWVKLLEARSRR